MDILLNQIIIIVFLLVFFVALLRLFVNYENNRWALGIISVLSTIVLILLILFARQYQKTLPRGDLVSTSYREVRVDSSSLVRGTEYIHLKILKGKLITVPKSDMDIPQKYYTNSESFKVKEQTYKQIFLTDGSKSYTVDYKFVIKYSYDNIK